MSDVRFGAGYGTVLKAETDNRLWKSSYATTYPVEDLAGDIVDPDGADFGPFLNNPVADFDHCAPVGRAQVFRKAVDIGGESVVLPFGTTTFFKAESDTAGLNLVGRLNPRGPKAHRYSPAECVHNAGQARRLVCEKDIARGVSLEFTPVVAKAIGRSLLERRTAYRFDEYRVHGIAHAVQQICPGALTLPPGEVIEKAVALVEAGKFEDGEVLAPIFLKALAPFQSIPRTKLVRSGFVPDPILKSDEFDQPSVNDNVAVGSDPDGDPDAGMTDDTPPEITDCDDATAAVSDLADRLEGRKTLDDGTRKLFAKVAAKLRAVGEELAAHCGKLEAKIGGAAEPADEPTPDVDEGDLEDAEETVGKAIAFKAAKLKSRVLKAATRFKLADLSDPAPVAKAATETLDPAALKAARLFVKKLQPYLAAAKANGLI